MAKTSLPPETRRVTLQETANLYQLQHGQAQSAPSLVLRGQWLAKAGFQAGQRVRIRVEHGHLTITLEQQP